MVNEGSIGSAVVERVGGSGREKVKMEPFLGRTE